MMKNLFFTASAALILAGCTQVSSEIVIEKPRRSEMLQEYYISRVEKNMEQTRRAVAKAKTRQDAMRLVENARKKVQSSFKNVKSEEDLFFCCCFSHGFFINHFAAGDVDKKRIGSHQFKLLAFDQFVGFSIVSAGEDDDLVVGKCLIEGYDRDSVFGGIFC